MKKLVLFLALILCMGVPNVAYANEKAELEPVGRDYLLMGRTSDKVKEIDIHDNTKGVVLEIISDEEIQKLVSAWNEVMLNIEGSIPEDYVGGVFDVLIKYKSGESQSFEIRSSDCVYDGIVKCKVMSGNVMFDYIDAMAERKWKEERFEDVKSTDWFFDAVQYIADKRVMKGTSVDYFEPIQPIVRAQFAVILHRLENEPKMPYKLKFSDVQAGMWYTDAILWAENEKIVTGYEDSALFGTADSITREQMAVMMYRYAKMKKYGLADSTGFDKFEDASSVSKFAQDAMRWAVGNGIITGKNNGTKLAPQGSASRAEGAEMLMRFMKKIETI